MILLFGLICNFMNFDFDRHMQILLRIVQHYTLYAAKVKENSPAAEQRVINHDRQG